MDYARFQNIVMVNAPFDTGVLMNEGIIFTDTAFYMRAHYDTASVEYIIYNEEGTKFTQVNKGFIGKKTVGAINNAIYSETLGLRDTDREENSELARRRNEILISQGAINRVI